MRASSTIRAFALAVAMAMVGGVGQGASADDSGASSLRLITYNLFNRPWERSARMRNALQVLQSANPDVVALQEVATGWLLPGPDAFDFFLDHLGSSLAGDAPHFFGRRHIHDGTPFYKSGIAVFSRYPIIRDVYVEFEDSRLLDRKGFQFTRIDAPFGELGVINLHMSSDASDSVKHGEFGQVIEFARSLEKALPVVILGDFNTDPKHPEFVRLIQELGAQPSYEKMSRVGNTWSPDYSRGCGRPNDGEWLDHALAIGSSGLSLSWEASDIVVPAGLEPQPSDHCAVTAALKIERKRPLSEAPKESRPSR